MRPAAVPPGWYLRPGDAEGVKHRRGWQEWVRASIMPVAIGALSPLGDGLRELFFPTRAAVSGTVTLRGSALTGHA